MNKRIKELAEKAGFVGESMYPVFGTCQETALNNFAGLIIQECSVFVNHFSDGHEKDQFGRNLYHYTDDIGQVILEHFGVK